MPKDFWPVPGSPGVLRPGELPYLHFLILAEMRQYINRLKGIVKGKAHVPRIEFLVAVIADQHREEVPVTIPMAKL